MTDVRQIREWTKDGFLLSTDPALVPMAQLISTFDSSEFYWARSLPAQQMRQMIDNSMIFAVYEVAENKQISTDRHLVGFARNVTDYTTFAYLTDVWVKQSYQGKGLGAWMVGCIDEVLEDMPHLRRTILFTGDWQRSVPFYERLMGAQLLDCRPGEGLAMMEKKGKGHPSYGKIGNSYT